MRHVVGNENATQQAGSTLSLFTSVTIPNHPKPFSLPHSTKPLAATIDDVTKHSNTHSARKCPFDDRSNHPLSESSKTRQEGNLKFHRTKLPLPVSVIYGIRLSVSFNCISSMDFPLSFITTLPLRSRSLLFNTKSHQYEIRYSTACKRSRKPRKT